ncbi:hypothetical protein HZH66_007347 [Vespula vulgaris]|uniref:Dynein regulatory complex protein 9 n=1 Tax=Vespula vulgaris TaxID=7454 RepID=A0A834N5H0_VESVU|nr:hypothetical protein HZH66_007347 [Vespula vulgaris]
MEEELKTNTKQNLRKLQQENALAMISSIVRDQSQRHVIKVRARSTEETATDIVTKKSALSLAMNLEKISKLDLESMVQKDIQKKIKEEKEEEIDEGIEIATIVDIKSKKLLQGEEFIIHKKRGGFLYPRPSIFPLPPTLIETETETIDTNDKVDDIKEVITEEIITENSFVKSENIGVKSMQFDIFPITILTPYEARAIASVLQECVDHLAIVRYTIPAEIDDRWDDITKPINEKYGGPEEPHIIIREETNLPPLMLSNAEKFQRDRTYMHKILKMTLDEIKHYRKFNVLEEEVNDIMRMLEDENNLDKTCTFWENQVNQLRQLIKDETSKQEREKRQLLKSAQMTKAKIDDTIYEVALKMGYVENWENARFNQHSLKITTEEQDLLNEIDEYQKKQIIEKIVTDEICAYYQENIKNMENEMLEWSDQYDQEMEKRQRDIDNLKVKVEEQKLEIQDLHIMKDERQEVIDNYLAEIKRLEEEAKYQALLNHAATVIQAAIRGYLVRHELGEYKNLRARLRKRKKLAAAKRRKLEKQRKILEEEEMKKLKDARLRGRIK